MFSSVVEDRGLPRSLLDDTISRMKISSRTKRVVLADLAVLLLTPIVLIVLSTFTGSRTITGQEILIGYLLLAALASWAAMRSEKDSGTNAMLIGVLNVAMLVLVGWLSAFTLALALGE